MIAPPFGDGAPPGPPWRTSWSDAESSPYSVVELVLDALFVYADATTLPAGASALSVPSTAPLAGDTRRFCSSFEVTRIASGIGLKSKPKSVPESAGVKAPLPTWVATPVAGATV